MFTLSNVGLFLLAALGLLLLPGPSVLYIITRSTSQGRRAGLASVAGVELASLAHVAAAALGISALLLTSALAFNIVKYIGAGYLVILGIRTLLTKHEVLHEAQVIPKRSSQLFAQGFFVNLLNPKTALFFYAFLPQFIHPANGAVTVQILILGALFVTLATCTDTLYALLGSAAGQWFNKNRYIQRWQRYISGCIYILLGVTTAISGTEKK